MKIFFLLNPSNPKKLWAYRDASAKAARRFGCVARFGQVDRTQPRSMEFLLNQAWEEGCTRLAVVGGDGTLHRAINVLHQQRRLNTLEIAVVPAGTCNDFARAMRLRSRRLEEALQLACSGRGVLTDLGRMDNELFLNNAGIGRRPAVASSSRPLKTLQSFRPIPLHVKWERGSLEGVFYMALVCNSIYFSGGLYFSRKPRVTDGLLDVYLVPPFSKRRLISLLLLGKLGRPLVASGVIALRVQQLTLEARTDLWPQADGEPAAQATRQVQFSISPEKAMIVVPSNPKDSVFWQ